MKRFGSTNHLMHPVNENDIFLSRLQLLIIMLKAVMKGYPVGKYRKKAALDNAIRVKMLMSRLDISFLGIETSPHLFKERVKLLTVMTQAIVGENYPMGVHRREAILENIAMIESTAFPYQKMELFDKVLKVA